MATRIVPGARPAWTVKVNVLPSRGFPVEITANESERGFLAAEAEALSVERFVADMQLTRWRRDGVRVSGRIHASLVQPCVVTLEPVASQIDTSFEQTFLPEGSPLLRASTDAEGEMVLDPDGEDLPDAFQGDSIDVWAVAIEQFLLAVDPFPRAPGAELPQEGAAGGADTDRPPSPFAVLAKLKDGGAKE